MKKAPIKTAAAAALALSAAVMLPSDSKADTY
jgi:hypothetical protein